MVFDSVRVWNVRQHDHAPRSTGSALVRQQRRLSRNLRCSTLIQLEVIPSKPDERVFNWYDFDHATKGGRRRACGVRTGPWRPGL